MTDSFICHLPGALPIVMRSIQDADIQAMPDLPSLRHSQESLTASCCGLTLPEYHSLDPNVRAVLLSETRRRLDILADDLLLALSGASIEVRNPQAFCLLNDVQAGNSFC